MFKIIKDHEVGGITNTLDRDLYNIRLVMDKLNITSRNVKYFVSLVNTLDSLKNGEVVDLAEFNGISLKKVKNKIVEIK